MPTWLVDVEGRVTATVEVEADTEEEALAKAESRGLERTDYFEIADVKAIDASEA